MATLIKTNGIEVEIYPENELDFSLEEMQNLVEGSIQTLYLKKNKVLVINEEGKLLGLPINEKATEIALENKAIYPTDFIVGNVLLCEEEQIL